MLVLEAEVLSTANQVWKAVSTELVVVVYAAEYAGHCRVVFPLSVVTDGRVDVLSLSSLVEDKPLLSRVI